MEGVPWIERVEVGMRVEQDVHVTVCGTTMGGRPLPTGVMEEVALRSPQNL